MPDTYVRWHKLEIAFAYDLGDDRALFDAIAPTSAEIDALPPIYVNEPDSLHRRFVAWGFSIRRWLYQGESNAMVRGGDELGLYGDYTVFSSDERFFTAIAPFVQPGSYGVFERSRHPDEHVFWDTDHEAWLFEREPGVIPEPKLVKAEREIEWNLIR